MVCPTSHRAVIAVAGFCKLLQHGERRNQISFRVSALSRSYALLGIAGWSIWVSTFRRAGCSEELRFMGRDAKFLRLLLSFVLKVFPKGL